MSLLRELEQQLRDAKRQGDKEWAAELEDRIAEERAKDQGTETLKNLKKSLTSQMDDNPENDEQELEELYNPVAAELENPVQVLGSVSAVQKKVAATARQMTRKTQMRIENGVLLLTFYTDVSFLAFVAALGSNGLGFGKQGGVEKLGTDTVIRGKLMGQDIKFYLDVRGYLDLIEVH